MEMKKNVGASDRYVRVILGLGFIMNIFALEPTRLGLFILLIIGLILWNTAFTQYCPIYDLLKINTYEKPAKPEEPAAPAESH
ncbi:MAG: DUF2892 domain-containing protein [Spirochaetes bacterium]|nr:DUF2892 domain-containing protein [Spirochaetota bacterium]